MGSKQRTVESFTLVIFCTMFFMLSPEMDLLDVIKVPDLMNKRWIIGFFFVQQFFATAFYILKNFVRPLTVRMALFVFIFSCAGCLIYLIQLVTFLCYTNAICSHVQYLIEQPEVSPTILLILEGKMLLISLLQTRCLINQITESKFPLDLPFRLPPLSEEEEEKWDRFRKSLGGVDVSLKKTN